MLRIHATPTFRRGVSLVSFALVLLSAHLFVYPRLEPLMAVMNAFAVQNNVPISPPFVVWMALMMASSTLAGIVTDVLCGIPPVHDID